MGQSPEEFRDFLNENKRLVYSLIYGTENNFIKLFELKDFKVYDLVKLIKDKEASQLFTDVKVNNFTQLFKLKDFTTKNDLVKLVKDKEVVNLLKSTKEEEISKLFELEDIRTTNSLIKLVSGKTYTHIKTLLYNSYSPEFLENLEFFKLKKSYYNTYNIKV
jgi:Mg/Co/Ni transporter MgtE